MLSEHEILERWKHTLRSLTKPRQNKTTLPEVSNLLRVATDHVLSLKDLHSQLSTVNVGSSKSRELWSKVEELKNKVDFLSLQLSLKDKKVLERKVKGGMARRERRKADREKERERRAKVDEACTTWLDKKQKYMMRKRLEKSVEKDAGGSLGEVRKKLQDLETTTKLIEALKDLREHRHWDKKWKMEALPIESDERFTKIYSDIKHDVSIYKKIYDDEEYALKVMMSEQVDARMTASQTTQLKDPIMGYYYQAEKDVASFVHIRQQWDKFLSPLGTSIPYTWVDPVLPSNDIWASYLKQ